MDEVQRHNLRLLPGEAYEFAPFSPPGKAPPAGSFEAGALGSSGGGGGQEGAGGLNSDSVDADEPEPFDLVDLEVEVRLADPALFGFGSGDDTGGGGGGGDSGDGSEAAAAAAGTAVTGGEVEADAEAVARALSRAYFGRVVCLNEVRRPGAYDACMGVRACQHPALQPRAFARAPRPLPPLRAPFLRRSTSRPAPRAAAAQCPPPSRPLPAHPLWR